MKGEERRGRRDKGGNSEERKKERKSFMNIKIRKP